MAFKEFSFPKRDQQKNNKPKFKLKEVEQKVNNKRERFKYAEEGYYITVRDTFAENENGSTKEALLTFSHPKVKEFQFGRKNFQPDDLLTVSYINSKGEKVETQWTVEEYLKRIGIEDFSIFQKIIDENIDLERGVYKFHQSIVQERINKGFWIEQKFEKRAKGGSIGEVISRERQLRSQREEDPYFIEILARSNYIYPIELSRHHDYIDMIDILVEIDPSDFYSAEEAWAKESLYIGIQRTLLPEGDLRLKEKERKIREEPFRYLPEYPDKNPVLRILYKGEQPEEYYLEDGTSRLEMLKDLQRELNRSDGIKLKKTKIPQIHADKVILGNTPEEVKKNFLNFSEEKIREKAREIVVAKTLDVLYQALDNVVVYQTNKEYSSSWHKQLRRYEKCLRKILSIIEKDTGFTRQKVEEIRAKVYGISKLKDKGKYTEERKEINGRTAIIRRRKK